MKPLLRLVILPAITGIIIAAGILYFFPSQLQQASPGQSLSLQSGPVSYADAVSKAVPAVVNIYTTKIIQQRVQRHSSLNVSGQ